MSRMRIKAKLRTNPEFKILTAHLDSLGFRYEVCAPTGKGHPFLRIDVPGIAQVLTHHIACTPRGGINAQSRVAGLKRAIAAHYERYGGL